MFYVGFRLQTGAAVFCRSRRGAHNRVFLWWVAHFITPLFLFCIFPFSRCTRSLSCFFSLFLINISICWIFLINNVMLCRNSNNRLFLAWIFLFGYSPRLTRWVMNLVQKTQATDYVTGFRRSWLPPRLVCWSWFDLTGFITLLFVFKTFVVLVLCATGVMG